MPFSRMLMVCVFLVAALLAAGCGAADPLAADAAGMDAAPPPVPFWQDAARPYQGHMLRGITEDSPPSRYIRDLLAPAFEAETGIHIELIISENSVIEQVIAAGDDAYDFVYIEQDVIYGYLEDQHLTNLSALLDANPQLAAPAFDLTDFTDFLDEFRSPDNDDIYGVPIEAFIKIYAYRQDLFADPAVQAAFAEQYSYPLAPAVTVEQYRDIAEFFTAYGAEQEIELYGSSLQAAIGHNASFYEFFETIAPSFGIYDWGLNLESNRATVAHGGRLDSEQAVAALTFWLDLLAYAPPQAVESTWSDVAHAFAAGHIAQGWLYGEYVAGLATDDERSKIAGDLGVALPPSAPGVVEDAIAGVGYVGYYDGAAFGIPAGSTRKEAALLWLQYLGSPAVQPRWAVETSRIVHLSTFDDPLVQAQDDRLNGYYTLMKRQGNLFAGAPPVPYHAEVRDVIAPFIHQAIAGLLTPEEALSQAAAAVDIRLIELGYADDE